MHRHRIKTAGWAAFGREHQEKRGIGAEDAVDPCSSFSKKLSSGMMESSNCFESGENLLPVQSMLTRPFCSVVQPSTLVEFPLLKAHTEIGASNITIDDDDHVITVKSNADLVAVLKDCHSWADLYLIQDILAAVDMDVGQASILLKEMAPLETEIKNVQPGSFGMSLTAAASNQSEDMSENSHKEVIIKQFHVPTEPEWEEDDVYLSHRKEALKKMRLASQHSRTASNAYMRGDHLSAQQLSSRAREEWMTAEKLNAQAAEEILRITNSNNDVWKLDLHGLHATEAVHALAQHLERLESESMTNRSASSKEVAKLEQTQQTPSFDSLGGIASTSSSRGNMVPQKRTALLHVITGTGNHSKGQAALPVAVKSFLLGQGYRFDDARPGVISVRPKFRHKRPDTN